MAKGIHRYIAKGLVGLPLKKKHAFVFFILLFPFEFGSKNQASILEYSKNPFCLLNSQIQKHSME